MLAGVATLVLSMLAFVPLQYADPSSYPSYWGELNHRAILQFEKAFSLTGLPAITAAAYAFSLRTLMIVAWLSYVVSITAAARGGVLRFRTLVAVVGATAAILAVLCPPSFSVDAYGYLAHSRLQALYGLNPYTHSVSELKALNDASYSYTMWHVVCPYGPVWTIIGCGVVTLLKGAGLWAQVVALKLIVGAALIAAAVAARRIADHFAPGRGSLAFLAVGLNPLFLVEGPINGHNDLVMMSLLLIGITFYLRKNYVLAALFAGLSASIKLVTILTVPLMAAEYWRRKRSPEVLKTIAVMSAAALIPLIVSYAPFWEGLGTLGGVTNLPTLQSSSTANASGGLSQITGFVASQWSLLAVFIIALAWVLQPGAEGRWLTAWIGLSGYMALFCMGIQFPWYLAWPWTVSLARPDRLHLRISTALFFLAFLQMWMYSVTG